MRAKAEIITIGDEILYGQTLDTNSHWISGELDKIGIRVVRKTTIPDREDAILNAFSEAEKIADIILITGGLGPTNDDLTKPCLAKYFEVDLKLNEEALEEIKALFERVGRVMNDLNKRQALLPTNSQKISNTMGTAPGMWIEHNNKVFISMPGVPYEMKNMMSSEILPRFIEKFVDGIIHHKILRTAGIPESRLAEMLADWESNLPSHIKLAYLPSTGLVKLRLTATGTDSIKLAQDTDRESEKCKAIVGKYMYATEDVTLQEKVGQMLTEQDKTLAVAESCTGGFLSHLITSIPGSSKYFVGSFVPYSNEIKENVLGVSKQTLMEHGAVSESVVLQLAENVRKSFGSDIGVSISGIAGPSGGTEEKPVGTVWVGYSDKEKTVAKKFVFTKNRKINIELTAATALNMVRLNNEVQAVTPQ